MAQLNITLRRHNGSGIDELYPHTTWGQIDSKPTTFTPTAHSHGNITNDGKIGASAGLMIKTTTGGLLTTLAAGTTSQFLRGDGTWATPSYDTTNNYITGISGSGNGTVTVTRSGLTNLTWDASHTHDYLGATATAVNSDKVDGLHVVEISQSAYDALGASVDGSTLYLITG